MMLRVRMCRPSRTRPHDSGPCGASRSRDNGVTGDPGARAVRGEETRGAKTLVRRCFGPSGPSPGTTSRECRSVCPYGHGGASPPRPPPRRPVSQPVDARIARTPRQPQCSVNAWRSRWLRERLQTRLRSQQQHEAALLTAGSHHHHGWRLPVRASSVPALHRRTRRRLGWLARSGTSRDSWMRRCSALGCADGVERHHPPDPASAGVADMRIGIRSKNTFLLRQLVMAGLSALLV